MVPAEKKMDVAIQRLRAKRKAAMRRGDRHAALKQASRLYQLESRRERRGLADSE